jgi:antibiotic biosynthesis monooxygenase (ABM) superfamily enzyme
MTRPRSTTTMHATIRQYTGVAPTDFDTLMSRKADIETLIRKVPGFVQYDVVRTADGMTTMTVCDDKAGTEASNKQVAEWIGQNVPTLKGSPPVITDGENMFHFTA